MSQPDVSVVAFESKQFNILNMLDQMGAKGWHLNALQRPLGYDLKKKADLYFIYDLFLKFLAYTL